MISKMVKIEFFLLFFEPPSINQEVHGPELKQQIEMQPMAHSV